MLTIATWNVNSIRARHDRFFAWLDKAKPDVVCLQELKTPNDEFPTEAVEKAGYHVAVHGQPTWNGVAILSKEPVEDIRRGMDDGVDDPEARFVAGSTFGVTVLCVYVPNGKTVGSDKWEHKLAWMSRLRRYLEDRCDPADHLLLCGDINVAPDERDVENPERWAESVLCAPEARKALSRIVDWGLHDTLRLHYNDQGPYSWWDYRRLAFPKNDGLRIDHVFATSTMADLCTDVIIDREERKGTKPSDHAPVIAFFER